MENVMRIVNLGMCTGCGACTGCKHIRFEPNALGFRSPVVDDGCERCGKCAAACIFDPEREDDD